MVAVLSSNLMAEEQIVAELTLLGIRYLSRLTDIQVDHPRPGEQLLADLVRQPSSREGIKREPKEKTPGSARDWKKIPLQ